MRASCWQEEQKPEQKSERDSGRKEESRELLVDVGWLGRSWAELQIGRRDARGAGELQGVLACSGARQEKLTAVCVPLELRFPLKYILGEMGKNAG